MTVGVDAAPRPWRVLIVEDDEDAREIVSEWLGDAGFEVVQAENGARGVEVAVERQPDVIVTDLDMPVMDGFEEIARLHGDKRTREIPVVVLSGSLPDQAVVRRTGSPVYLTKPCAPDDLGAIVTNLAEAAHSTRT